MACPTLDDLDAEAVANPVRDQFWTHRHSDWVTVANRHPDHGMVHRRLPAAAAAAGTYLRLNNSRYLNFLAVDIDGGREPAVRQVEAFMAVTGIEGSYVLTPHGVHLILFIDPVLRTNARAVAFYDDIRWNLTRVIGGDPAFANHLIRNPETHLTVWRSARVWGLRELRSALDRWWQARTTLDKLRRSEGAGQGRNADLFTKLTMAVRDHHTLADVEALAHQLADPALPTHEIRSCAKSAWRRHGNSAVGPHTMRRFGQRGGTANTPRQQETRRRTIGQARTARSTQAQARASQARSLRVRGMSIRGIAAALGLAKSTVQSYLRQAVEAAALILDLDPARVRDRRQHSTGPLIKARRLLAAKPIQVQPQHRSTVLTADTS